MPLEATRSPSIQPLAAPWNGWGSQILISRPCAPSSSARFPRIEASSSWNSSRNWPTTPVSNLAPIVRVASSARSVLSLWHASTKHNTSPRRTNQPRRPPPKRRSPPRGLPSRRPRNGRAPPSLPPPPPRNRRPSNPLHPPRRRLENAVPVSRCPSAWYRLEAQDVGRKLVQPAPWNMPGGSFDSWEVRTDPPADPSRPGCQVTRVFLEDPSANLIGADGKEFALGRGGVATSRGKTIDPQVLPVEPPDFRHLERRIDCGPIET